MSDRGTPTRAEHQRFCEVDGWYRVSRAPEGPKSKYRTSPPRTYAPRTYPHWTGTYRTYEAIGVAGRVLYTRILQPADDTAYSPRHWAHIQQEELDVSTEEFWRSVDTGELSVRPGRTRNDLWKVGTGLPVPMVYELITLFDQSEAELAGLTRDPALKRLIGLWRAGRTAVHVPTSAHVPTAP